MALWLWICGWPLCVPSKRGHLWWLSCCVDSTRSGEILVKDKDNFFLWSIDTFHITLHIQSKNPCEAQFMHQSPDTALCQVLVTQSCPTLWDPTDYSPPGYSVLGIFQARVLEWSAIAFSILGIRSSNNNYPNHLVVYVCVTCFTESFIQV